MVDWALCTSALSKEIASRSQVTFFEFVHGLKMTWTTWCKRRRFQFESLAQSCSRRNENVLCSPTTMNHAQMRKGPCIAWIASSCSRSACEFRNAE
jgi:hypothetical protein